MARIDTKRGREALAPRREPYWQKLSKGRYLGIRKLPSGHAAWIARYRDDEGTQHYKALGEVSDAFGFDEAKQAAETWMRDAERGVSDRHDDGSRVTVASACLAYVRSLRAEGRLNAAHDAHMRFRRTVYGDAADDEFGLPGRPAGSAPRPPPASCPPQRDAPPPQAPRTPLPPRRNRRGGCRPSPRSLFVLVGA